MCSMCTKCPCALDTFPTSKWGLKHYCNHKNLLQRSTQTPHPFLATTPVWRTNRACTHTTHSHRALHRVPPLSCARSTRGDGTDPPRHPFRPRSCLRVSESNGLQWGHMPPPKEAVEIWPYEIPTTVAPPRALCHR
jgi:hypothetical protein